MNVVNVLKVFSLLTIAATERNRLSQDSSEKEITGMQKAENEKLRNENLSRQSISLWPNIDEDQDLLLLKEILQDIEGGRGKSEKFKKLAKFMYPLFMGVFVAKIVFVPLMLKMLTAISASAVVMSKVALITTGFVALKWIFSAKYYDSKDRFEFIYLPAPSNGKPYRSASGSFSLSDDQSWSDSDNQYISAAPTAAVQKQKYIPVHFKHELPHKQHRDAQPPDNGFGNSIKDLYYFAQHNHKNNVGKPFL